MKKYWNEKQECMDLEERKKLQLEYLQKTLNWVYLRVRFYREKFEEAGISTQDIRRFKLEDLQKLPFTVKNDLRDNYPFGLCAAPMSELAEIHASSGTTGKPIIGPYTKDDMKQWSECMARTFWAAGVRPEDVFQNAYGMGLFTGGLGFVWGIKAVDCTLLPTGPGGTERQITLMKDLKTTVLGCTPSYALTIAEKAKEMGVDIKKLPLRIGIFGAEPWIDALREKIEERLGIRAHEAYGLTELMGPGVAFSCYVNGKYTLHINEDHVYPEIIDPEPPHNVLPLGTEGELVLTSLQRQAMPMIRYRTKDITRLYRKKCACGRTLITMDRVSDRSDDMKIVNGVNVFPSQIEDVVMKSGKIEPLIPQIILRKGEGTKKHLDVMIVKVEAKRQIYDMGRERVLEKELAIRIKDIIGVTAIVEVVKQGELPRSTGKAKRLIDERK